jgi:uncharacterized protein
MRLHPDTMTGRSIPPDHQTGSLAPDDREQPRTAPARRRATTPSAGYAIWPQTPTTPDRSPARCGGDLRHCTCSGPTAEDVDMTDLALRDLDHTECLALLATTNLGRLALTRRALPMIVPARYLVYDDRVVIHLSTGLDHIGWIDGEVVALQVSAFDDDQIHGWTVSITGAAHGTPDPTHIEDHPNAPWIPRGGGDLITLSTDVMRGERLGPSDETKSVDHPSSPRQ